MIHLKIDEKEICVSEGSTILEAAAANDIFIPSLCNLKGVCEIGSCRLCMVEESGFDGLLPACRTKAAEGMDIRTDSGRLSGYRRTILKLILANHRADCMSCLSNGNCRLQDLLFSYGIRKTEFAGHRSGAEAGQPTLDQNPFLSYEPDKCIHCQRCIHMCKRQAGNGVLTNQTAGNALIIEAPFGRGWKESGCESCGNCAQACPTGALSIKRRAEYREWEVRKVLTTCPHCATGCQLYLVVKNNRIVNVEAADGPANHGLLCVKGRSGSFDFVHAKDRLTKPLIRVPGTDRFREAEWDEAISYTAERLMAIRRQYGDESLAGFACSRSANEDIYMVQKMVRTCFGNNNTDNCARVCHSATVAGLAKTLGSGAMTNPIYDITHDVDCILLIGSNPEEAHPVIGMQIRQAAARGTRLIVADPRSISLARQADLHLKLKPGTNVAFINGMIHVIIKEGLADQAFIEAHTENFEEIRRIAQDYTPDRVGEICHIDPDMLQEAARMYAVAKKAPIIYCLGVTEHTSGTEGVMSLSNLALLCGKLGKSGCGVNPLRGQNNVQGACDMGTQPTDYPGYQKVDNDAVRKKFERAWGVSLNPNPGLKATEVFPAATAGKIRGLYICGEDPVVSDPDTAHIEEALKSLEFLVVQDLFFTKTAAYADVILPAVSYAEKEGTFTNTERRVQRIRKAVTLPGQMRSDIDIITDLMNAMGYPQKRMSAAEIMDEIAELTPSYHGISHARLDAGESLQWPCPDSTHPGTPIMHAKGPARGKALFYPAVYRLSSELPDEEYPFILNTGRILYQYNAASITMRSPGLVQMAGEGYIELHVNDAGRLGISDGERVIVRSRRGKIDATARVGKKVSEGETWMAFHFPDSPVNRITNAVLDEFARIPEYKVCAVAIEKA